MKAPGLVKSRLARLHEGLAGFVEREEVPGVVALVSRGEDLHVDVLGQMGRGASLPMQRDTIFRIASISKPVTAVAAMILVEECRLRLDEPVDLWIPELANRRVLRSIESELEDTVPAVRPITARHLLTSTMGFGSVMAMPDRYPIQRAMRTGKIGGDGPPRPAEALPAEQWIRNLGALPLMAQPGEQWLYHVSIDVLGLLVARVAGKSLGEFLTERIFGPLGMKDTAFFVPRDKIDRLPPCYAFDGARQRFELFDDAPDSEWATPPAAESGAGGLVGTLDDYFAFARMLLGGGKLGKERILAPSTVAMMTADQLTLAQRAGTEPFLGDYRGWGFGMSVDTRRRDIFNTPGRFGWDGGTGTSAYVDPAEGVIGILLTQRMMDSPEMPRIFRDFWTLAYGALK